MNCEQKTIVNQAAEVLKIGDGTAIKRLIDFLGSEQFAKLLALLMKLGGLFGGTAPAALSAEDEQKALDSSGVNFAAVADGLKEVAKP